MSAGMIDIDTFLCLWSLVVIKKEIGLRKGVIYLFLAKVQKGRSIQAQKNQKLNQKY